MTRPLIGITVTDSPDDRAERYIASLALVGADAVLLRPASALPRLETLHGLILSGGVKDIAPLRYGEPADPRSLLPDEGRDAMELDVLLPDARRRGIPVLGICRGFQLLNVGYGGKLVQHYEGHSSVNDVSGQHPLDLVPGCRVAAAMGVYGPVRTNSRHHQCVVPGMVAPGLRPTGMTPDGLIEAIESIDDQWVVGLQCHPERSEEVDSRFTLVFKDFVENARRGL
jgi:gamma-glutamyl-gamma-aminobutyrate hydrolase PuuD